VIIREIRGQLLLRQRRGVHCSLFTVHCSLFTVFAPALRTYKRGRLLLTSTQ